MNKKEYPAIVVAVCLLLMSVMLMGVTIKHVLELKPDHSVHAASENVSQEDREEYVDPVPHADPNTPEPATPEPSEPDEYIAPDPDPYEPDEYVAPAPPKPAPPEPNTPEPNTPEPSEPDKMPQLLPEGGCTPILDL